MDVTSSPLHLLCVAGKICLANDRSISQHCQEKRPFSPSKGEHLQQVFLVVKENHLPPKLVHSASSQVLSFGSINIDIISGRKLLVLSNVSKFRVKFLHTVEHTFIFCFIVLCFISRPADVEYISGYNLLKPLCSILI